MAELRDALAGFQDVRTYLASGNVVLSSDRPPEEVGRECERLIEARFGFPVDVVMRTRDELAEVVGRNPLADLATEPKRYQVTFLAAHPDPELVDSLTALANGAERLVAIGRELYAWHPDGVARSRLSIKLASPGRGIKATARNWTTVTSLLELADRG